MEISNSQNDLESRYAFLLQPIRNLAENFDVDLTHHLSDYLSEIEKLTITVNGGKETLNFAEAALIIRGSASVYCKKVDYLHGLTVGMLDTLGANKRQQNATDTEQGDQPSNAGLDNTEPRFLTLDDVEEGQNTFLRNDDDGNNKPDLEVETPLVLLRATKAERDDHFLMSRNGEILANKSDFCMNSSYLHGIGAMVLDPADLHHVLTSTPCVPRVRIDIPSAPLGNPFNNNEDVDDGLAESIGDDNFMEQDNQDLGDNPAPAAPGNVAPKTPQPARRNGMMRASNPKKDKIQEFTAVQFLDPHQPDRKNAQKPFKKGKVFKLPEKISAKNSNKRKRKSEVLDVLLSFVEFCQNSCKQIFSFQEFEASISSLGSQHDLHDRSLNLNARSNITSLYQLNQTGPIPRLATSLDRRTDADLVASNVRLFKTDQNAVQSYKIFSFADLEDCYWSHQKHLRQLRKKVTADVGVADDDGDDNDDNVGENFLQDHDDDDYENAARLDNLEIPDVDVPLDQLLNGDNIQPPMPDVLDQPPSYNSIEIDLSGARITNSYEELVRCHVEGYMASAQQYIQDTALAQRVADWEEKIVPRLQEEETRRPFDIHVYGTEVMEILDRLHWSTEPVAFSDVVSKKPAFEVCRYLLSALQLANYSNVEISNPTNLDQVLNALRVKLVSRRRHFDELSEYRAPSFQ